ncbi:MAG: hypothetical protein K0S47_574 [Herbinix sp.]|jgi:hypothetical protein|nr:hypothetical protein [Herbinix sp.]
MSNPNNQSLSDKMNEINIAIQELVDLTDIMLIALEGGEITSIELAISGISILKKELKVVAVLTENAISSFDGLG